MKRFLPAALLLIGIVLSAPFVGLIRDFLFGRFHATAVRGVALALLTLAVAAFLYALARIRRRRLPRYAGLALAAALLVLQESLLGAHMTDVSFAAQVNVAEKVHLVEYGLLAFLFYRAFRPAGDLTAVLLPLLWIIPAGVLEESVQWLVETRVGEIRDVFLNLYAGVCGLIFGLSLEPPESFAWRIGGRWRQLWDSAALAVLALGLFFYVAHLGYEHHDPEIGRFRSWHTLDELRQAALEREQRWQVDPPTELSPWRREDLFLNEASWHANHRNERYRAGDSYMAYQANRILEQYYSPFLDIESFRGSGKHRYAPEQRQALEAAAPRRDPESYLSPVLIDRIYPWPSKRFLLAVLIPTVLAIWLLPRIVRRTRGLPG